MRFIIGFCIALLVLGLLDFIWLGNLMHDFYKQQFGLMGSSTMKGMAGKWWAILSTYLLMALGFALFVFSQLSVHTTLLYGALWGALFGLVLFGVYDFTNYIVFTQWPLPLVFVDIIWGMFAYAVSSVAAVLVMRVLR
jgi:uncharacterized membrane protein